MDAIRRILRLDQLAHRRLRLTVGNGDRRRIPLALGGDRRAKMRPYRLARGVGEAVGKGDLGGKVHGCAVTPTAANYQSGGLLNISQTISSTEAKAGIPHANHTW